MAGRLYGKFLQRMQHLMIMFKVNFKSKYRRHYSIMVMTISTSHLYPITSNKQPKDVWDAENHSKRDTLANN